MTSKLVKVKDLKNNTGQVEGLPKNPRFLRDDKFQKLKNSIQQDPEMLDLREVLAYDNNGELIVIGGNMRLRACVDLGIKEVPCKILPKETTIEKLKAYTIKDNASFGDWDFDALANEWDAIDLEEWGVDVPDFIDFSDKNKEIDTDLFDSKMTLKLEYTEADYHLVKDALSNIASTPEQAIYTLLKLG